MPACVDAAGSPVAAPPAARIAWPTLRRRLRPLLLLIVLGIAAALRFYDLNWDQSQYNHPDERHVTNVITLLRLPASLGEYLDSAASPLNPYNNQQSWVYGTLPLFTGRILAEFLDQGCAPDEALLPRLLGRLLFSTAEGCARGFFTGYEHIRLVGRLISALADTITVLVVYLIGRRLFGWRVGLLAAAFNAFAVLQIQHSKFFVVESMLTMWVAWCVYFCARLVARPVETSRQALALLGNAALAGLCAGLAVASKISAWPTALLILIAVMVALVHDRRSPLLALLTATAAAAIAGLCAFASFRLTQPYGFVGGSAVEWAYTVRDCDALADPTHRQTCLRTPPLPNPIAQVVERLPAFARPILAPSARWVAELQSAAAQSNGTVDPPWGWQWAGRLPIVFPLVNIVFYGLGLPLGVTAVIGAWYMLAQLWRGRRWYAYLVPTVWIFGFFLYQGTQFVKSLRYQLPIYPLLCIAAAVVLLALLRRVGLAHTARRLDVLARGLVLLVLVGAAAWALAFMRIYDGELTRTEASRWIYRNVPTALTLVAADDYQVQLPVREIQLTAGESLVIPLRLRAEDRDAPAALRDPRLVLNYLEGQATVRARLLDPHTQAELASAQARVSPAQPSIALDGVTLDADAGYLLALALVEGDSLRARTSVIANQHFDEGIPFRLDGKDGFGQYYYGLSSTPWGDLPVYHEDDPSKFEVFLRSLNEADYLILNSNRHYASVARLPWRFPMTNAYYRALMAGELGFALVADFHRFPRLGPFVFNDQEMPQHLVRPPDVQGTPPAIEIPYPKAEEAFSVYDHPRVLIFKKRADYSPDLVARALSPYVEVRTLRQTALRASETPNGLLLDQATLAAQQAGGTWRVLFPRESPLNRSPLLAILAWVGLIEALGVAGFVLLAAGLRRQDGQPALADGGYAFGKALGLLLPAFAAWWLASLKVAPFAPVVIWGVIAAFLVSAAIVGYRNRSALLGLLRARWPLLLVGESLFLLAFAFFLLVRAGNPDLWHPYFGGEKPMDFAYLNAVLRATYFPPQDPWFAGGAINYYYFGFVLVGTPVKALGIDPAVAYNLIIPALFALTASGAFGLGASFYVLSRRRGDLPLRRAILAGSLSALFATFIGNAGQINVVGPAWLKLGGIDEGTPAPLALLRGVWRWLGGAALPIAPWWPYWNPTRPAPEVMIAEFPLFTFLYADLHAHMIAMPLAYLTAACALGYAAGARSWASVALGAIAAGMLWPTNSWDYPTYALLTAAGLCLGALSAADGSPLRRILGAVPALVGWLILSRLAMLPYLAHYGAAYNALEPWEGDRTRLDTYLIIHGLFLIPIGVALFRNLLARAPTAWRALAWGVPLVGAAVGALLAARDVPVAVVALPLTALAAVAALRPELRAPARLFWLATAGALALTLFVELFTLRGDIGRMNTQFKFYIQVWLLLSVAAAVTCLWVAESFAAERLAGPPTALRAIGRWAFGGAFAVALGLGLLYPAFAIPAKINDRYVPTAPRGLDGMAYMRDAIRSEEFAGRRAEFALRHDYDAIRWMQDNVEGSPTILEEGAAAGNQYRWSARFSIYTGLPTVVGWEWHQRQQRAALAAPVVEDRVADVREFYSTVDPDRARLLLRRYGVRYVILGAMERLYNDPAGLDKFDVMVEAGDLRPVYRNPGVTIYEVLADGAAPIGRR
jgi:YYY domain-containing protein